MFLVGMIAVVKAAAWERSVHVEEYNIGAIRSHFIGGNITSASKQFRHLSESKRKGAARAQAKASVIGRCMSLGWAPQNDNEADAAALWDFACSRVSRAHQIATMGGLFNG